MLLWKALEVNASYLNLGGIIRVPQLLWVDEGLVHHDSYRIYGRPERRRESTGGLPRAHLPLS